MAKQPLPTPEQLRQLLRYEPETGKLFWLERTPDMFVDGDHSARHSCAAWNAKRAGTEAFTATNAWGHRRGNLFKQALKAHRVAWAIHYGEWPTGEIDHANGDPADNRIVNLRIASSQQNKWNRGSRPGSQSRFVGVQSNGCGKWYAQIVLDGQFKYLGTYDTEEEAALARDRVALKHHGEFARLNFPGQLDQVPGEQARLGCET